MISLNKIFYGLFILMLIVGVYTYQLMWFKSADELITLLLAPCAFWIFWVTGIIGNTKVCL